MPIMDQQTAEHFYAWLERTVHAYEQHETEQAVHAILRDYPELVETRTWPEIVSLGHRMLAAQATR